MKLFVCGACGQTLYFDNVQCTRCGHLLGFVAESLALMAFAPAGEDRWQAVGGEQDGGLYRQCGNYARYGACNWMVPAAQTNALCLACRLNRTIPDLSVPVNITLWQRLQTEKNRLVYGLLRLGLPVVDKQQAPDDGLAFDFLADPNPSFREGSGVITGHAGGVITLDVAEADDAVREQARQDMAEPYRTILGHFRHESGHYYWDRLVRGGRWLATFREHFGDERQDYDAALAQHYADGPPSRWADDYVSAYASCHPWEDWAESWAHYLHILDTLETAWEFGLRLEPRVEQADDLTVSHAFDPFAAVDFYNLIEHWLPLTVALNSLNQSMGRPDAYPFVLTGAVVAKLEVVHRIVRDAGR